MKTIHIDDSTGKGKALLKYLLTLDIVRTNDENFIIPETEKELMRERYKNAKEEDFKDWDEIKKKFNLK